MGTRRFGNGTLLNSQPINHPDSRSRRWGDPFELSSGDIITVGTSSTISVQIASLSECSIPFGVGLASDPMSLRRGGTKLPMEDVCYYQWPLPGRDQIGFSGICDGHGGAEAAKFASKCMPMTLPNVPSESFSKEKLLSQKDASHVLRETFYRTEEFMNHYYEVYLGEQFVNNATLSDITFLVEGRRFCAHRICLLASSDAFNAMFDGGYREKDAREIEIPNIRWDVFELMMRYIYTGSIEVTLDIAQDLLGAADQYLLEGLKRLCEYAIARDISLDNVSSMYELSEAFNALSLRHSCILFILEHFDRFRPGNGHLVERIVPEIQQYFAKALAKPNRRTPVL